MPFDTEFSLVIERTVFICLSILSKQYYHSVLSAIAASPMTGRRWLILWNAMVLSRTPVTFLPNGVTPVAIPASCVAGF